MTHELIQKRMQERILSDGEKEFCNIVRKGLQLICGYTAEAVEGYFQSAEDLIFGSTKIFFSDPPGEYIIFAFVRKELSEVVEPIESFRATTRLLDAFQEVDLLGCFSPSFDW